MSNTFQVVHLAVLFERESKKQGEKEREKEDERERLS